MQHAPSRSVRTSTLSGIGSTPRDCAESGERAHDVVAGEWGMVSTTPVSTPWWSWIWPLLAWVILGVTVFTGGANGFVITAAEIVLIATVFAAVYHAEVVAHRVGEPFGTLVLAVAVTVIEVTLIVTLMVGPAAD